MNYKKIYELNLHYTKNVIESARTLKYEMNRISKLWEKTDTMNYTLFTKREIMKLMQDEFNDFEASVKNELRILLDQLEIEIKKESGE